MQRFDEKSPLESVVLTFDFSRGLALGETLTGAPSVSFATLYGGDTSPAALANGAAMFNLAGTLVLVPVTGGIDQNDYLLVVECATSNSQKVLALPAILPVRAYPQNSGCGF